MTRKKRCTSKQHQFPNMFFAVFQRYLRDPSWKVTQAAWPLKIRR